MFGSAASRARRGNVVPRRGLDGCCWGGRERTGSAGRRIRGGRDGRRRDGRGASPPGRRRPGRTARDPQRRGRGRGPRRRTTPAVDGGGGSPGGGARRRRVGPAAGAGRPGRDGG